MYWKFEGLDRVWSAQSTLLWLTRKVPAGYDGAFREPSRPSLLPSWLISLKSVLTTLREHWICVWFSLSSRDWVGGHGAFLFHEGSDACFWHFSGLRRYITIESSPWPFFRRFLVLIAGFSRENPYCVQQFFKETALYSMISNTHKYGFHKFHEHEELQISS